MRMPLVVVACFALTSVCNAALADDGIGTLAKFRAKYKPGVPYRCSAVEWSIFETPVDPAYLERLRAVAGVREMAHPATGQAMIGRTTLAAIGDGTGSLRVESRDLAAGGRPDRSGSVSVWNESAWARPISAVPGSEVQLTAVPALTAEDRRASHARGELPLERVRAEQSFIEMVRWVRLTLDSAEQVKEIGRSHDGVEFDAVGLGVRVVIDPATGALRRVTHNSANSMIEDTWWWEGEIVDSPLPHPHFQLVKSEFADENGVRRERFGNVVEFVKYEYCAKPPATTFAWQSIAQAAWDRQRQVYLHHDGTVDEERTRKRNSLPAVTPTTREIPSPAAPIGDGTETPRSPLRWWTGAGAVVAIVAGVWFWKRRPAT